MCTMNVSLECPMKQKDDEDASQATTFEEEEDKFSLSLSIFTSFFLSFLWTKFICTETAQRFSCKKKKIPPLLSRLYNIIKNFASTPPSSHHPPFLFQTYTQQNDTSISYQIECYDYEEWIFKAAFLAYLHYYIINIKKAAKSMMMIMSLWMYPTYSYQSKEKKKSYSHLALVSLYNNYNNKTTFRLFLFE